MWLQVAVALGCLCALDARPAAAQNATGLMTADEEMVQQLLRPRSVEDLTAEYEQAKQRAEVADKDLEDAAKLLSVARARVNVKNDEISLLKTRSKLAGKEANDTGRADIEKTLSRERSALKVFEAMRKAAEAQKNRAAAAVDFARARMSMQKSELDLAGMDEARLKETAAAPAEAEAVARLNDLDARIRKASRAVLASLREYAKMSKRLGERTDDLAEARIDLLDAWESYKGL